MSEIFSVKLQNNNILLTGARGFVGAHLERHLYQLGATVIKLDRLAANDVIPVDLNNFEETLSVISNINFKLPINYIFHLAAQKSSIICKQMPLHNLSNTFNAAVNLLEVSRNLIELKKFILISSVGVYGSYENGYNESYHEINPPTSESIYTSTKTITEALGLAYAKEFNLPVIVTRLSNIYGPNQSKGTLIPDLISQMNSHNETIYTGSQFTIRDYIHIDDVVSGLVSLICTKNLGIGEIYNISSGLGVSVKQIIDWLVEFTNFRGVIVVDQDKVRPNEKIHLVACNSKLINATQWRPVNLLKESLKELCKSTIQK